MCYKCGHFDECKFDKKRKKHDKKWVWTMEEKKKKHDWKCESSSSSSSSHEVLKCKKCKKSKKKKHKRHCCDPWAKILFC